MKRLLTTTAIAILFCLTTATAQDEIEIPTLTSIEVDAEGIPVLNWKMQNPDLVDGYIIKRLIVDGQGVISGTYNNVAIIEDRHTFTYADRSNEYGTFAMTSVRKEYYCIAAYVIDDQGKKHYSLMTEPASTIFATGSYNVCDKNYILHYSSTDDADHYTIHQLEPQHTNHPAGKDTVATLSFDTFHQIRRFQIECTATNGICTFSPIIEIEASDPTPPATVDIALVTVDDNNKIALNLNLSPSQSTGEAYLLCHDIATGIDSTYHLADLSMSGAIFTDPHADPDRRYSYILAVNDKCGHKLAQSDSAYNIVATATAEDSNVNIISWNKPHALDDQITGSQILRQIDNQDWEQAGETGRYYNDFEDYLHNLIADETLYNGQFCYQVLINCQNGDQIRSNVTCLQREPVVYIPNALNPKSDNMDNRTFRPRADFLADYHLAIYDKRGALLFQSDDLNVGWDGYDRTSKLCHRDTYIYHITYKTSSGKQVEKSGMVNLLY